MEITKLQQEEKELANDHWAYVRQVLAHDCVDEGEIERVGFHFREAFKHGFKHADEKGE